MTAAHQLGRKVGRAAACRALNLPRASLYRHFRPREQTAPPVPRPSPPRALAPAERQRVLEVLHSERFRDKAPAEVFATLLDEGTYLCSVRTMYRILEQAGEVRERRDQLRHPHYQKPQLLATGPNQVWSWDITKLLGPVKWTYFYLYVILDIFSRYVVGWMVAERESAELAKRLIAETLFDVEAAVVAAAICNEQVSKLVGAGTETQFKFRGVLQEEKPLRDWLQEVLMNCLGYYTFANGKLKLGVRVNSSAVEAFTEGNILFRSLQLAPLKCSGSA